MTSVLSNVASMFGIIYQKRQDLLHLDLKKYAGIQLNSILIRFQMVQLLIQEMRQRFRYESLYVPTWHSLLYL